MLQTIKVSRRAFVTLKEDRRTDGFCEIGVYVDPVLPGASLILVAAISRQAVKGGKWCVYSTGFGRAPLRTRSKQKAIDHAYDIARWTDAGKMHEAKVDPTQEQHWNKVLR